MRKYLNPLPSIGCLENKYIKPDTGLMIKLNSINIDYKIVRGEAALSIDALLWYDNHMLHKILPY